MADDMERVRPLEPSRWSDEVRSILGGTDGNAPGILHTIAHLPELLRPFLGFTSALALRGTLPRRESELLALRAAWNCRSSFEWGHHVEYAKSAGLSAEEIDRAALPADAEGWTPSDRALIRAADELHRGQMISDSTWSELASRWDASQLVEIPFVVGNYTMLSMVANSTGVALEAGYGDLPDPPTR